MKKILIALCLLYILPIKAKSQIGSELPIDSSQINKRVHYSILEKFDKATSTKFYRMTYIAIPLIAGGLMVKSEDDHFRNLRTDYFPTFHHGYDNYTQHLPGALMLGLKMGGVQGRSSWGRMLTADAFSAILVTSVVLPLKSFTHVMRPDGSSKTSFPSGHSATAFMEATMLDKEYGNVSPWISVGGYTAATATALTRMTNNRHWLSDVMVGAGIGIISTQIGYLLSDLIFKDRGIHQKPGHVVEWDRDRKPSFLGLYLGFVLPMGDFVSTDGNKLSAKTGSSAGFEGAYFLNKYIGIGGRFTIANFLLSMNGEPLNYSADIVSEYAGAYLSYPLTPQWSLGGKLLLGYNSQTRGKSEISTLNFNNKNCIGIGTGASLGYSANDKLSVKFLMDYNFLCKERPMQLLTIGASACIVF